MLQPIDKDHPAGTDVSYDADFEALETEIRKMESLSGGTIDWPQVVLLAEMILNDKSKDFRVAAYLLLGYFRTQGYAGLAEGLTLYGNLIETFWENGFPAKKRMRARINVLQWVSEKTALAIEETPPTDGAAVQNGINAMKFLQKRLEEKIGDTAPRLGDLDLALGRYAPMAKAAEDAAASRVQFAEKMSDKSESADEEGPATDQGLGAAATETRRERPAPALEEKTEDELSTPKDAERKLREIQGTLKRLASFYRKENPQDARAYRFQRMGAWLMAGSAPPDTGGKTRLPAPPKEALTRFQELLSRQEWAALLEGAETKFSDSVFWLDLQRYVWQAMNALGEAYEAAKRTVAAETASLLTRIPELPHLLFSNGTPLADGQTNAWLTSEILLGSQGDASKPDVDVMDGSGAASQMTDAIKEARTLAVKGDLKSVLSLLQQKRDRAPIGRNRFMYQFHMARFCREMGRPDLALPQLQKLEENARQLSLASWEPALCSAVYRELYLVEQGRLQSLGKPTPKDEMVLEELFTTLCRLDAVAAMEICGKK